MKPTNYFFLFFTECSLYLCRLDFVSLCNQLAQERKEDKKLTLKTCDGD